MDTINRNIYFDDVAFGIAVKDARRAAGLTQSELARKVGYADGVSISSIEIARCTETITVKRYFMICNELNLNPMHYWYVD